MSINTNFIQTIGITPSLLSLPHNVRVGSFDHSPTSQNPYPYPSTWQSQGMFALWATLSVGAGIIGGLIGGTIRETKRGATIGGILGGSAAEYLSQAYTNHENSWNPRWQNIFIQGGLAGIGCGVSSILIRQLISRRMLNQIPRETIYILDQRDSPVNASALDNLLLQHKDNPKQLLSALSRSKDFSVLCTALTALSILKNPSPGGQLNIKKLTQLEQQSRTLLLQFMSSMETRLDREQRESFLKTLLKANPHLKTFISEIRQTLNNGTKT